MGSAKGATRNPENGMLTIKLLNEYLRECENRGYYPNEVVTGNDVIAIIKNSEWKEWRKTPTDVRHYAIGIARWITYGEPIQLRLF